MKKIYRVLAYCTKHSLHHGQKWPSCVLQRKEPIHGSFSFPLSSGGRVSFEVTGALRARDIAKVYKLIKLQHYPYQT